MVAYLFISVFCLFIYLLSCVCSAVWFTARVSGVSQVMALGSDSVVSPAAEPPSAAAKRT